MSQTSPLHASTWLVTVDHRSPTDGHVRQRTTVRETTLPKAVERALVLLNLSGAAGGTWEITAVVRPGA